jgi:hypothetical protein
VGPTSYPETMQRGLALHRIGDGDEKCLREKQLPEGSMYRLLLVPMHCILAVFSVFSRFPVPTAPLSLLLMKAVRPSTHRQRSLIFIPQIPVAVLYSVSLVVGPKTIGPFVTANGPGDIPAGNRCMSISLMISAAIAASRSGV